MNLMKISKGFSDIHHGCLTNKRHLFLWATDYKQAVPETYSEPSHIESDRAFDQNS